MDLYGLYDKKQNEQCVIIGTIEEIASFLNYDKPALYCYLSKKKKRPAKLLKWRYELIKINL